MILSIASGSGYTVGTPSSAQTIIDNSNVPTVQITGGSTISPGASTTLTITANQAPLQDTQVDLSISGSAVSGTDYTPVQPVATLSGQHIDNRDLQHLEHQRDPTGEVHRRGDRQPSPASYAVGSQGSAVIGINGGDGLPSLTLSSATNYLQKGQPYDVTIS